MICMENMLQCRCFSFQKDVYLFFLCNFTTVIKINAYENETFVVELGNVCCSVLHQSVRHAMDGTCREMVYPSERISWHCRGNWLQPVVAACFPLNRFSGKRNTYLRIFFHRIIPVSLSLSWMERLTSRNLRPLVRRHVTVRLTRLQESPL